MGSHAMHSALYICCCFWLCSHHVIFAQLAWTPIYVDGKSQIDLWTRQAKGCACPWENPRLGNSSKSCACCVQDGGCHCGKNSPNRCTQCGLEQYCNHMCNVTIASAEMYEKSGKYFGQIKSPSLEGPNSCWYTFAPQSFQRVEIQIYRLVNTGKFNGTICIGGYLQLMSGTEPLYSQHENQLCGTNERYSPPIVFFSDEGIATLLFEVTEKTKRSQFLAYFSFSALNATDGVGLPQRGGMRLQNTDCDWLYQDFACEKSGQCIITSPGYPGIYPPHRQCKYHITTSNANTIVGITFTAVLLPLDRCAMDYVAIYQGTTTSSPLLHTLCGSTKKKLEYSGSSLLIEFRSGPQQPPFEYNGFVIQLEFLTEVAPTATMEVSTLSTHPIAHTPDKETITGNEENPSNFTGCDIVISGNGTSRSGQFDSREYDWHSVCRISFHGKPTDIVQILFTSFRLRTPTCKTIVEVFDGASEIRKNLLEKLCSPQIKQARDPDDVESKKLVSSASEMVLYFQRPHAPRDLQETEFIAGRYYFHDEMLSGTLQPTGMCDVIYNGETVDGETSNGVINNPSAQHLYWNMEGPLICRQKFQPTANQSIVLKIQNLDAMAKEPLCFTQCGDKGCRCVTGSSMEKIDHLLIVNDDDGDYPVACLCGYHQQYDWLPVSVRSWNSLSLVYSVAHYTWRKKGFGFSATFAFKTDSICGDPIYTLHAGEITLRNLTRYDQHVNHFYVQGCTWTLHSNVERQLELDINSKQNRPCTAWNISIHEYSANANQKHLGHILHTFCSRDAHKVYVLPWKVSTVIVRLYTLSRTLPSFSIKWKSQAYRARENTRFIAPTPAPSARAMAIPTCTFWMVIVALPMSISNLIRCS